MSKPIKEYIAEARQQLLDNIGKEIDEFMGLPIPKTETEYLKEVQMLYELNSMISDAAVIRGIESVKIWGDVNAKHSG